MERDDWSTISPSKGTFIIILPPPPKKKGGYTWNYLGGQLLPKNKLETTEPHVSTCKTSIISFFGRWETDKSKEKIWRKKNHINL